MTQVLTDLKFEIDDVGPARQAEIEAKFESVQNQNVEFHETLLQQTVQLQETNEGLNGMEHRMAKTEFDLPGMARELDTFQVRIDGVEKNVKGGGKGAGTRPPENLTKHKALD